MRCRAGLSKWMYRVKCIIVEVQGRDIRVDVSSELYHRGNKGLAYLIALSSEVYQK